MQAPTLPLYPQFDEAPDGTLRSIIHYKDYEPMFENYGVPPYIAGLNVSAIAYKTDKWNISRLDNSFQLSGVMTLDSDVNNEEEAKQIAEAAQNKFAGETGTGIVPGKKTAEARMGRNSFRSLRRTRETGRHCTSSLQQILLLLIRGSGH